MRNLSRSDKEKFALIEIMIILISKKGGIQMDKILEKLKSLVESGQLTEEEFEVLSKSLLSNGDEGKSDEPEPPSEKAETEEQPTDDSDLTSSSPKEGTEEKPEDTIPESENELPPTEPQANEGTADNPDASANSAIETDDNSASESTMEQPIATEVQSQLDAFAERIAALEEIVSSLSHPKEDDDKNDDFGVGAGGDLGTGNGSSSVMAAMLKKLGYSER